MNIDIECQAKYEKFGGIKIMKTVTVNYYTIDELKEVSPKGYANAFNDYEKTQFNLGYNWVDDAISSVKKFLSLFDCELDEFVIGSVYSNDYRYTDNYIYMWNEDEQCDDALEIDELEGEKLKQYLELEHGKTLEKWDYCPLTGYCLDITLLEPLHQFMTGEKYQDSTLKDLIDLALHYAIEEVDADYEYQCGYEAFEEDSRCNDYYYDINGNLE